MEHKLISLTFDDGPNNSVTNEVLDRLEKYNVPASFFLIGENINMETRVSAERALKLGCDLENHSFTHTDMTKLTPDQIQTEIGETQDLIKDISGVYPEFFRPPYIVYDQKMYDNIPLTFICGAGCEDWIPETSVKDRYERSVANSRNGEMLLLHDCEFNSKTAQTLDLLIPRLLNDGFEFVTERQLFSRLGVKPQHNKIYSNVFD